MIRRAFFKTLAAIPLAITGKIEQPKKLKSCYAYNIPGNLPYGHVIPQGIYVNPASFSREEIVNSMKIMNEGLRKRDEKILMEYDPNLEYYI